MMAAIVAAKRGHDVRLIEKNEKLGKKIYITGKGRCNFTNACDIDEFVDHIVSNRDFMYSSLNRFSPWNMIDFMKINGLESKIERGKRVFPLSDHASDITKVLTRCMIKENVHIDLNTSVFSISLNADHLKIANQKTKRKHFRVSVYNKSKGKAFFEADRVIVATGGLSYPETGSDGDGYIFARSLGLKVNECSPSLGPLITDEDVKDLSGLSLKNVRIVIYGEKTKKPVYRSEIGELTFLQDGMGGSLALLASAFLSRGLFKGESYDLYLDLKPGLSPEKLNERLLRDLSINKNMTLDNALKKLLISPMRQYVIERAGISHSKKASAIQAVERINLLENIRGLKFKIHKMAGFEKSLITQGGLDLKELNPKTMECKKIPGLFFVGEVLDVDALTGGFNLQIAWSSGYAAGESV